MNYIYLDTLFLINLFADYLSLVCAAKISGAIIYRKRIILASIIGGIYACICIIPNTQWIAHAIIKICVSIFICLISFWSEIRFLRCYISFIAVSAIFGGILSFFTITIDNQRYLTFDIKLFILIFSVTYFTLSSFYRRSISPKYQKYHNAEIHFKDSSIRLTVLNDTGNELYDPITNTPIMIVEKDLMLQLIPELSLYEFSDIYEAFLQLQESETLRNKIRILPFQSISSKGVIIGIIPDRVLIDQTEIKLIIGIADKKLSNINQYQGIY